MNVTEWLRMRAAAPPPALGERISVVLGDAQERAAAEMPSVCLDAADVLLRDLVSRTSVTRDSALDLLTVDALVTYAFEAAGENPASMPETARSAMRRFARAAAA